MGNPDTEALIFFVEDPDPRQALGNLLSQMAGLKRETVLTILRRVYPKRSAPQSSQASARPRNGAPIREKRERRKPARTKKHCKITIEALEKLVMTYFSIVKDADRLTAFCSSGEAVDKVIRTHEGNGISVFEPKELSWEVGLFKLYRELFNVLTNKNGKRHIFLRHEEKRREKLQETYDSIFNDDGEPGEEDQRETPKADAA